MFSIVQMGWRPGGVEEVRLRVAVVGKTLIINDRDEFDFSFMEPGSELPRDALDSDIFRSDVTCDEEGLIRLTIAVPYGPTPSEEEVYPPVLERVTGGVVIDVLVEALTGPGITAPDKTASSGEGEKAEEDVAQADAAPEETEEPFEEAQNGEH